MPNIFINNCEECKELNTTRTSTSDSFDVAFDWFCGQKKNEKIAGYIGPFDKPSRCTKMVSKKK